MFQNPERERVLEEERQQLIRKTDGMTEEMLQDRSPLNSLVNKTEALSSNSERYKLHSRVLKNHIIAKKCLCCCPCTCGISLFGYAYYKYKANQTIKEIAAIDAEAEAKADADVGYGTSTSPTAC